MIPRPPKSTRTDTRFPYTTLFRSHLLPQAIGLQPPVEHPFRLVLAGRYIVHRILAQPLGRELLLDLAGKAPFVLCRLGDGGRCFGVTYIHLTTPWARLSSLTSVSDPPITAVPVGHRSEARRVGIKCVSTRRLLWLPNYVKKNKAK